MGEDRGAYPSARHGGGRWLSTVELRLPAMHSCSQRGERTVATSPCEPRSQLRWTRMVHRQRHTRRVPAGRGDAGTAPGPGIRQTPIRAVLLTDAELDHTIGLLMLRQSTELKVDATEPVLRTLEDAFPLRRVLQAYTELRWIEVTPGVPTLLDGGRLRVRALPLSDKRPRYAAGATSTTATRRRIGCQSPPVGLDPWVVAYALEDTVGGARAVYAPAVAEWTPSLLEGLRGAACAFVDGTYWSQDEMVDIRCSGLHRAADGPCSITGKGGTAELLGAMQGRRSVCTHMNNTNPVLDGGSAEHRALTSAGLHVGHDGMEVEI